MHGVAGSAGTNDHEALPVWRSRLHSAVTLTVVSHPGWHLTTLDVRECANARSSNSKPGAGGAKGEVQGGDRDRDRYRYRWGAIGRKM